VISTGQFYVAAEGPPKQGDLLFAGVVRLVADDHFTPPAWGRLDAYDITVQAQGDAPELRLVAGPALVMVTSHDCHFDKEWNQRRRALIREGLLEEEAERIASADATLDRTFNASPLLRPDEVRRDRRALLDGKILGYLPVPPSPDGVVPEAVVDLTYRVTLDRFDVHRVASVSEAARAQLRYVLVQLDSYVQRRSASRSSTPSGAASTMSQYRKNSRCSSDCISTTAPISTFSSNPTSLVQGPRVRLGVAPQRRTLHQDLALR